MFCDPYNYYMETRLKTCLSLSIYIYLTMFSQHLFSKDLTGSLLEVITSIRRPIYTYLYVHILMIKIIVLFSFYMLTDVNVKSKCTCVNVQRFKDMFANSKRLLAVATTACRPGFYSQPSVFYFKVFYFAIC